MWTRFTWPQESTSVYIIIIIVPINSRKTPKTQNSKIFQTGHIRRPQIKKVHKTKVA
jgi:hypothetical protein